MVKSYTKHHLQFRTILNHTFLNRLPDKKILFKALQKFVFVFFCFTVLSISNGVYAADTDGHTTCPAAGSGSSTLSLSVDTNAISVDFLYADESGLFASSTPANISVETNHCTGYTLSIKAETDSAGVTELVNTSDSTKAISSLASAISELDFSAPSNIQYNNKWGYKPSKYNSVANTTNYYPAPTAAGDIIDNRSSLGSATYTVSLGARIDSTTVPGTYSNAYTIIAITNPTPYSITYDANTVDIVTNMPSPNPDSSSTYDSYAVISSTVPERSGYVFNSWCSSNNSEISCDGNNYQPGGSYPISQISGDGNTTTLYAIWEKEAMLDTGRIVNAKMKRVAGNTDATDSTQDSNIIALARANALPEGFAPTSDNTITVVASAQPVYIFFDGTDGTMYYYTETTRIKMNPDSSYLFYNMYAISDLATISTWCTSSVTSMSGMFTNAGYDAAAFNLDLSSWDTSSVTDMYAMFNNTGRNATIWSIGDLSTWDTSSVTNMGRLFSGAGDNATIWSIGDLSTWDTSSVTSMSAMFYYAGRNATTWFVGDLSTWDTSSVTDMGSMFNYAAYSAASWSIGDLSTWDTSSVTSMSAMFYYAGYRAASFTLNLSSWDTSNVTEMNSMFYYTGYNATSWSIGNLSSWNTSSVTNMSQMFRYAGRNATTFILNLSSWDTSSVTDMHSMFDTAGRNATTWSIGDLSSWDTSSVTSMYEMFTNAGRNATTFILNLSSWDTSSVTKMSGMFSSAGLNAATWSVTIPKTNDGTATGSITNTTSNLYGKTTSYYATPPSGKSFTLAN